MLAQHPADHLIDRAVAVVEHQPPHAAGDHRRDHRRDDQQRDEEALEGPLVEEVVRQQQPEQELQRQRHRRDRHGVQHRVPQALILEQAAVVQEALEVGVLIEQAQLLEADDHGVEEREQAERQQDEDGRRDQQILETAGCRRAPAVRAIGAAVVTAAARVAMAASGPSGAALRADLRRQPPGASRRGSARAGLGGNCRRLT